jgi:two-component system NtrC family sensor kinase
LPRAVFGPGGSIHRKAGIMFSRSFSLQTRFLVGLSIFATLAGVFIFSILYFHLKSLMESEVSDKSRLVLSMADAVQDYVRRELRPEMYKTLPSEKFIIKAMSSSYISRHVMERLNVDASQYYYRRVALNARNINSVPTALEKGLILYFRSNPGITHWEGIEFIDGQDYYISARPVVYVASCMRCHGQPGDAPRDMLEMYGSVRGFGYPVGQVNGVVCAGFPIQSAIRQIKDVTFGYLTLYLAGMMLFFILISFYFNKLVVHNLHRLTSIFDRHFVGDEENRIIEKLRHRDEIEALVNGMEELAAYLGKTRQQLEDYAGNLLHQKDMLHSVFEGISDPLMLLDSKGSVLMANKGADELIEPDRPPHGRLVEMLRNQFGFDPAQASENLIARCLRHHKPWARTMDFPDRRSYWISIYPIRAYPDKDDCVVMYARDVTAEKQMLARMQRAEKLSAIGKLAAGLAHEINNPLGTIQCYTDILTTSVSDEQARQDLEIIGQHTRQAQHIVQDLLNFARPKSAADETCDLNTVVENVIHVFEAKAATKSIRLETELARPLPWVKGSVGAIEQILTNIWLNAFDALSGDDGCIKVATAVDAQSGDVQMIVADNGPGIPDDVLDTIFDPFFTTKEVGQGTGLGLAVAYGLAEELGGRIEVENRDGAIFTVFLPKADPLTERNAEDDDKDRRSHC